MSVLMGEGPQVNNFEQVSSDGHQMSPGGSMSDIKGAGLGHLVPCLMSRVGKTCARAVRGQGACTMKFNASWVMVT